MMLTAALSASHYLCTQESYVYGTYIDDIIAKIEAVNTPTILYYHTDRQFNVRGLTDSTGNIKELYAYSVYGQQTIMGSGGVVRSNTTRYNNYGFTGRYLDDETGLWYFRARYFDDELGRFISRDPLGYVDGMSLYAGYFAQLFAVDPSGLKANKQAGAKAIKNSLAQLIEECKCCVDKSKVDQCKKEAKSIVDALAKMWTKHWGKGPGNDKAKKSDTVGGYFCWDWANAFQDAAESVNFTIWKNSFQKFKKKTVKGKTSVHYAVLITIANPKGKDCDGFSYDDGFFDSSLVHGKACKKNDPWPKPNSPYKQLPKNQSDPGDYGHPPVIK